LGEGGKALTPKSSPDELLFYAEKGDFMADEYKIRTILFREGGWWVAQCLDFDIAAQAKTEKDLLHELERLLVGRVMASEKLGVEPFQGLPPAPRRYWEMFFEAESETKTLRPFIPVDELSSPLPEVEMRVS
jgi:hypothetical protein